MASFVSSVYDLAFQVSPIILVGGIAANSIGGALPIIALTGQIASFALSAITSRSLSLNDFYAHYIPVQGGQVINNAVATYPFANQSVAGNAMIEQPLAFSLLMIAPVNQTAGYLTKLALFTSLRTSLQQHINLGGMFSVATPAYIYTNCLLTNMTDVTDPESRQKQTTWQLDFFRPLVTQPQAQAAMSGLMGKLAGGQQVTSPAWSSPATAVGSAMQGALSAATGGITRLVGEVNQFLAGTVF